MRKKENEFKSDPQTNENLDTLTDMPVGDVQASSVSDGAGEAVWTPPAQDEGYWKKQGKRLRKHGRILPFIIPAALFSLIFSYIPMLGIIFAFKGEGFNLMKGDVIWNISNAEWTFRNFIDIFYDAKFLKAVGNTLIINVLKLLICFPLSIIFALQLAELKNQRLAKAILIIVCIPNFLSWAIVIGIWQGVLHPDTGFLGKLFFAGRDVMAEDEMFKFFVIALSIWKNTGWGSIIYYAAITSIDKSYYEAATIDGANKFQKAFRLTLPAIMPTIALMLVLQFSGMMAAGFEQIYTMMQSNAELVDSQITLDTYLYDISVVNRTNIPFATALGVFNGLIALALMLVGNKITTKTLHRSLW